MFFLPRIRILAATFHNGALVLRDTSATTPSLLKSITADTVKKYATDHVLHVEGFQGLAEGTHATEFFIFMSEHEAVLLGYARRRWEESVCVCVWSECAFHAYIFVRTHRGGTSANQERIIDEYVRELESMQAATDMAKELKTQKLRAGWLTHKHTHWHSDRYKGTSTDAPSLRTENQPSFAVTSVMLLTQPRCWYESTHTDPPLLCPEHKARLADGTKVEKDLCR